MSKVNQTKIFIEKSTNSINKKRKREVLNEEDEKEIKYLIEANSFKIQQDVFDQALENAFSTNKERLNFLTNYQKFEDAIRNEHERLKNLFPRSKKAKYFYDGKRVDEKLSGARKGNEILRKRIEEKINEIQEYEEESEYEEEIECEESEKTK